jgi:uncharacterized protein (DUF2062 family)
MTTTEEAQPSKKLLSHREIAFRGIGFVLAGAGIGAVFSAAAIGAVIGTLIGWAVTAFLEQREKKGSRVWVIVPATMPVLILAVYVIV